MSQGQPKISSPLVSQADDTPHVGSLRWGPALTGTLYLVLVGSAALALWARQYPGDTPRALAHAAPWLFLVFGLLFSVYRLVMVQARKYPAAKAFFQIGVAALFFTLLLPRAQPAFLSDSGVIEGDTVDLAPLLEAADPRVRALAAELARHRGEGPRYGSRLVKLLSDADPRVREAAHASLVQLTGSDLGAPGDVEGLRRWGEKFP